MSFELSPEREAESQRIEGILKAKAAVEIKYVAWLLASKSNRELLGATEFQVRDAVHRPGSTPLFTSGKALQHQNLIHNRHGLSYCMDARWMHEASRHQLAAGKQ